MFDIILSYILIGVYIFLGLYFNYMLIRDDIRQKKTKSREETSKKQLNSATL